MARIIAKFRFLDEREDWEDIIGIEYDEKHIPKLATKAQKQKEIVEVRWNYKGSLQGHYVPGRTETRAKHYGWED